MRPGTRRHIGPARRTANQQMSVKAQGHRIVWQVLSQVS
jgi:hypothetical protein